jgi:hypothetical protein
MSRLQFLALAAIARMHQAHQQGRLHLRVCVLVTLSEDHHCVEDLDEPYCPIFLAHRNCVTMYEKVEAPEEPLLLVLVCL